MNNKAQQRTEEAEPDAAVLEQQIAAALGNDRVAAVELYDLIEQTEAGIEAAEATVRQQQEVAYDPALSPDLHAAREAIEDATFLLARRRIRLPRLRQHLENILAAERTERWLADYQAIQQKIEEAAERFAEYPELAARLVEIFTEAKLLDADVARVNANAPSGERRRLRSVEATARGRDITISNPSLMQEVKLADWNHAATRIWPPVGYRAVAASAPIGGKSKMNSAPLCRRSVIARRPNGKLSRKPTRHPDRSGGRNSRPSDR